MRPSPKSLIVDLLSTLPRSRRGSMPVRALVAAGNCFGIAENSLRVALTRLHAAETVERDERGRYRLAERIDATRSEVASWKTRHRDVFDWQARAWIGLISNGGQRPRAREAANSERALRLLGFRRLEAHLQIRPDNLMGGVERARERLHALHPSLPQEGLLVGITRLPAPIEQRALGLWDPTEAVAAYAHARRRLAQSEAKLSELSAEDAMVETFLVGGQVLRQVALDPLLPEEIVPTRERQALVAAMLHYDEVGRRYWAGFLEHFDVPHMRSPTDLRVSDAALATVSSGESV